MSNPSEPSQEALEVLRLTSLPDPSPSPAGAAYRLRALDFRWLSVLLLVAGLILLVATLFAAFICGGPCHYGWSAVLDFPSFYVALVLLVAALPCHRYARSLAERARRTH